MQPEPGLKGLSTLQLADALRASLPLPARLDPRFEAALLHVLENPGSLVRPRLVLEMAKAYCLPAEPANDLAIALEYFHTASLIFDDLPCMDNATERRGAPCIHVEFGDTAAILAALALINRAYALAWRSVATSPGACAKRAMDYLEKRLGVDGLLNGQSLDLNYSSLPHTRETTERIAKDKTVSLIRLTLVLPPMLAGAPAREIRSLERISLYWGLAYQIVDDLKDVHQNSFETGKTGGRDSLLDRPNIAAAIGVAGAIERLARLIRLGDLALDGLLIKRPALSFMAGLRGDLQAELNRVSEAACELDARGRP